MSEIYPREIHVKADDIEGMLGAHGIPTYIHTMPWFAKQQNEPCYIRKDLYDDLETKLAKAVELFKWIRLAVEEAEDYVQMGKKLEEIIQDEEFKTLEEIEKGE